MASEPAPAVREWTIDRRDLALACACGAVALAAYLRTLAPGLTVGPRLAAVPVHRPRARRGPQSRLSALHAPDLADRAAAGRRARLADQRVLRGDGRGRRRARLPGRAPARGAADRQRRGGAGLRRRRHVLVAGGDRRGLHAARRARRRPARSPRSPGAARGSRRTSTRRSAASPPASATTPRSWRSRRGSRCRRCSSIGTSRLRARTLVTSAAILALGLLPYALILVRSRDPQAYVESRATTLDELARVVLGQQFQDRLFSRRLARARLGAGAAVLGAGLRRRSDLGRARVRGDRRRLAAAAAAGRRAAPGQRRAPA